MVPVAARTSGSSTSNKQHLHLHPLPLRLLMDPLPICLLSPEASYIKTVPLFSLSLFLTYLSLSPYSLSHYLPLYIVFWSLHLNLFNYIYSNINVTCSSRV